MKIALTILFLASPVFADGPCKAKWEAQHTARKALHECLESWAKGKDAAPSDDCSAKLGAFTAAAKERIACKEEHKKK